MAKLLIMNPCYRLGAYGGIHELMAHSWFSGISWDDVRDKRLIPPFVPDLNVPNHSVSGDDAGINELRSKTQHNSTTSRAPQSPKRMVYRLATGDSD